MDRIRSASLCLVVALALAPPPAYAQGAPGTTNNLQARVDALEQAVAKLMGNITAADLVGTYNVYLLGIAMDPPGTQATFNQMASYAVTGTATLGPNLRGSLNVSFAGIVMTEQAANLNWTNQGGSQSVIGNFSWTYNSGTLTITPDPGVEFNDFGLSVISGGRALVGAVGGPPGNNQQLTVWSRK